MTRRTRTRVQGRAALPVAPPDVDGISWAFGMTPTAVEWLLPPIIPADCLITIQGRKGVGKSTLAATIAAAVSGGPVPPGWIGPRDRRVAWYAAEEHFESMVLPRLIAAGCPMDRVGQLQMKDRGGKSRSLSLPGDCERLRAALTQGNVGLLIIDPYASALAEGLNAHIDQHVRAAYEPLLDVLWETRCNCVVTQHLRKGTAGDVSEHGGGSGAIVNLSRAAVRLDKHPYERGRFLMSSVAKNFGRPWPSRVYSLCEAPGDVARLEWCGESPMDADAIAEGRSTAVEADEHSDAELVLFTMIGDEGGISSEIEREAERAGVSKKMLRTARVKLGIKTRKVGFGQEGYWQWLPPTSGWPESLSDSVGEKAQGREAGPLRGNHRTPPPKKSAKSPKTPKRTALPGIPPATPEKASSEEVANGQATD